MTSKRSVSAVERAPVVLLVEDDADVRNALERILVSEGLVVLTARSALHALQILDEQAVDVVVTDLRMPGPSGLRLLETVRDCWPEIRRVMLSAYITQEVHDSGAMDLILDKREDAGLVVDSIVYEARRRNGDRR